jgi:hypothetical protein
MKKLISFSVIFALLAGMVFAQESSISFGAWGRGVFAPLIVETAPQAYGEAAKENPLDPNSKDKKGENYAGAGVTWGEPFARIGFSITGNTEFVGFALDINGEAGDSVNVGDFASIWAKPFGSDLLKLTVGQFLEDTLRGKIDVDTGFENFVLGDLGKDAIFNRFASAGSTYGGAPNGFMLSSAPIEGLFIGFMVNGDIWANKTRAADAYRYMQIGAGYNIDGIGHIRAQYIGGYLGKDNDPTADDYDPAKDKKDKNKPARAEVAFALTAVDNLLVDIGAKIWFPVSGYGKPDGAPPDESKKSYGIGLGLGADFRADAFSVKAELVGNMGAYDRDDNDDKSTEGMTFGLNLAPAYDLDFATIGLSLGMRMGGLGVKDEKGDKKEKPDPSWTQFGFGAFVQKALGNGHVKAGLAYTLAPTESTWNVAEDKGKKGFNGHGTFSIPIILEYYF